MVVWVPARQARRRDKAAEGVGVGVGVGVWATGWEGEGSDPRRDEAVGMLMVVWRGSAEGDILYWGARQLIPKTRYITSRDCQGIIRSLRITRFHDEHEY